MGRKKAKVMLIAVLMVPLFSNAFGQRGVTVPQTEIVVKANRQKSFKSSVPPGNYSGIAWLGGNRYAVVDDKSVSDGFYVFRIDIDSVSGDILSVDNEGFCSSQTTGRDQEGVVYVQQSNTLYICGEKDNRVLEYSLDGKHTGRELDVPEVFGTATPNYGIEAVAYNAVTHRFWITSESTLPCDGAQASCKNAVRNRLRLQSFNDSLQPDKFFFYEMDEPVAEAEPRIYAMGVSELCALDDGRLIVLEREFSVPHAKLGAFVNCKLYIVNTDDVPYGQLAAKRQLIQFRTRLSLFSYGIANYEGMCVGPKLADGSNVLLMVSDSQNQYRGVLKDWFKTIIFR